MLSDFPMRLLQLVGASMRAIRVRLSRWTKPSTASPVLEIAAGLARSTPEPLAEHAPLRQQLVVLNRTVKRPVCTRLDRAPLVLLTSRVRTWRQALLRWHRQGCRLPWRRRSRAACTQPKLPDETAALIPEMARSNRRWGAERIQGELLKLGHRVSHSAIKRIVRGHRLPPAPERGHSTWRALLRRHHGQLLACDYFTVETLLLKTVYVLFFIELGTRRSFWPAAPPARLAPGSPSTPGN